MQAPGPRRVGSRHDDTAGPGAPAFLERQTVYPLSRLGEAAGQDILINQDVWRRAGLTDNEAEAILRRLVQVDRDRSLGFINIERYAF